MKKLTVVYISLRKLFDPSIEGNPFRALKSRKAYISYGRHYKRTLVIGR